jgi:transketolase
MVSVAAGIAHGGLQCWAYSIAPFIYARPFEQIRNDVCMHDVDVKLVGNGGGYGYGVMGATHHALEDYGVLCGLQNMRAYVPAFAVDVAPIVQQMADEPHPSYLRLGRCERPQDVEIPQYAPWRRLLAGALGLVVAVGPGVGGLLAAAAILPEDARPEIWVATELPFTATPPPEQFLERMRDIDALFVLEEHGAHGGAGQMLAHLLLQFGLAPRRFHHFHAQGYSSGRYGSQAFHRIESGLDAATVLATVGRIAA